MASDLFYEDCLPAQRLKGDTSFTLDDIDALYTGAIKLLYYFTKSYGYAIAPYKDGNAYEIEGVRHE